MSEELKEELQAELAKKDEAATEEANAYCQKIAKEGTDDADDLMDQINYVRHKEQECYRDGLAGAFNVWHGILIAMDDAAGTYIAFPDPGKPVSDRALYYFASCGGLGRTMATAVLIRRAADGDVKAMIRLAEVDYDFMEYLKRAAEVGSELAKQMLLEMKS